MGIRDFLFQMLTPIAKVVGKLHAPYSKCLITNNDYEYLKSTLKPYDIILTRSNGELTNLFIKGFYTHATMVVNNSCDVIEATGDGVHTTSLFDLLKRIDYCAVITYRYNNTSKPIPMIKYIGKPYDYLFKSKNSSYYCSELVLSILEDINNTKIVSDKVIYPSEMLENDKMFDVYYRSKQ